MKSILFILFISVFTFTKLVFSQTIAVINIEKLIDNNANYIDTVKKIELSQKNYFAAIFFRCYFLKGILLIRHRT